MPETAQKKLKITQVRSIIGCTKNQKDTIKALGLGRPTYFKVHTDSAILRGQLDVIGHLVKVEEVR